MGWEPVVAPSGGAAYKLFTDDPVSPPKGVEFTVPGASRASAHFTKSFSTHASKIHTAFSVRLSALPTVVDQYVSSLAIVSVDTGEAHPVTLEYEASSSFTDWLVRGQAWSTSAAFPIPNKIPAAKWVRIEVDVTPPQSAGADGRVRIAVDGGIAYDGLMQGKFMSATGRPIVSIGPDAKGKVPALAIRYDNVTVELSP